MRACKLYLLREKGKMGKGGAQVNRAATRSKSREGRRKRMRKKWNPVQYLCPFSLKKMQRNHYRKVQFAPSSPVALPRCTRIKSIPISDRRVPPRCRLLVILLPVHATDKTRRRMIRAPIIVVPARTGRR